MHNFPLPIMNNQKRDPYMTRIPISFQCITNFHFPLNQFPKQTDPRKTRNLWNMKPPKIKQRTFIALIFVCIRKFKALSPNSATKHQFEPFPALNKHPIGHRHTHTHIQLHTYAHSRAKIKSNWTIPQSTIQITCLTSLTKDWTCFGWLKRP